MPDSKRAKKNEPPGPSVPITCQWLGCGLLFPDGETLYEHLCGEHIGRKSTGTLSLECRWGDCTATARKRDHLTSHCRVHTPQKAYNCTTCNKAFKRPQDKKKHERTHTSSHQLLHKPKAAKVESDEDTKPTVTTSHPYTPYSMPDLPAIVRQQQSLNAHQAAFPLEYNLHYGPPYPMYPVPAPQYYGAAYGSPAYPHTYQPFPGPPPPPPPALYPSPPPKSLYPVLPSVNVSYPTLRTIKAESPAASSASQSPRLTGLSPPSMPSYSASPEQSSDASDRRLVSGNVYAGAKRGFEGAAEGFLANLKGQRYADYDDIGPQLDALSSFLLDPAEQHFDPALTPSLSQDESSGSSFGSDYSPEEVQTMNDLLLSLGEKMELPSPPRHYAESYPILPPLPPHEYSYGPLYPTLPTAERPVAPIPHRLPSPHVESYGQFQHSGGAVRYSKTMAPPTIGKIEPRVSTYRSVERLFRAKGPVSYTREPESMDDESTAISYSSSIRSTSLDMPAPLASTSSKVDPARPIKLAPILSGPVSLDEELLPPMTLAPLGSTTRTTLPPIHDLIADSLVSRSDTTSTLCSPKTSRTLSSSSVVSTGPSGTCSPAPASIGAGGVAVERLVHQVKRMKVRNSGIEMDGEMSLSPDGSQAVSEDEEQSEEDDEALRRTRAETIKALIILLNSNFRTGRRATLASRPVVVAV